MILSRLDLQQYLEEDRIALQETKRRPSIFGNEVWKFQIALRKVEFYLNKKRNAVDKIYFLFWRYRYHCLMVKLGLQVPPNVFGGVTDSSLWKSSC